MPALDVGVIGAPIKTFIQCPDVTSHNCQCEHGTTRNNAWIRAFNELLSD